MLTSIGASDSDVVAELLSQAVPADNEPASAGDHLRQALRTVLPGLEGAFSFVLLDATHVYGVRDPHGFRPCASAASAPWTTPRAGCWPRSHRPSM